MIGNILYVEYGEREQMLLVNFFKSNNNASCVFPLVQFQFLSQANTDFIQYRFAVFSFFAGFISLVVGQLTKFSLGSFQDNKTITCVTTFYSTKYINLFCMLYAFFVYNTVDSYCCFFYMLPLLYCPAGDCIHLYYLFNYIQTTKCKKRN